MRIVDMGAILAVFILSMLFKSSVGQMNRHIHRIIKIFPRNENVCLQLNLRAAEIWGKFDDSKIGPGLMAWYAVTNCVPHTNHLGGPGQRTNPNKQIVQATKFFVTLESISGCFPKEYTDTCVWKILRIVSNFIFDLVSVFQFESLLFKMDAQKTFQSAHIISDKSRFDLKIVLTDNLNEKKTFRWPGLFTTVAK